MDTEKAQAIADYLDWELGLDIEVRENYSGRAMNGSETTALVLDAGEMLAVAWAAGRLEMEADDLPRRQDNMGLNGVVLY